MKIIEMIMEMIERFFKKTDEDEVIDSNEEVIDSIVDEMEIDPRLTVSVEDPTGGEDRDVWVKVKDGE